MHGFSWQGGRLGSGFLRAVRTLLTGNVGQVIPELGAIVRARLAEVFDEAPPFGDMSADGKLVPFDSIRLDSARIHSKSMKLTRLTICQGGSKYRSTQPSSSLYRCQTPSPSSAKTSVSTSPQASTVLAVNIEKSLTSLSHQPRTSSSWRRPLNSSNRASSAPRSCGLFPSGLLLLSSAGSSPGGSSLPRSCSTLLRPLLSSGIMSGILRRLGRWCQLMCVHTVSLLLKRKQLGFSSAADHLPERLYPMAHRNEAIRRS